MRGTTFTETMLGTVRFDAGDPVRRIRLDLRAECEEILRPHRTTRARVHGRLRIAGLADDPDATGELEISPLARRRIRYRLTFTADGRSFTLDGWKSVSPRHPVRSMTVLPFTLYEDGVAVPNCGALVTMADGSFINISIEKRLTPSAGSHTYDLRVATTAGTVTLNAFTAGTTQLAIQEVDLP